MCLRSREDKQQNLHFQYDYSFREFLKAVGARYYLLDEWQTLKSASIQNFSLKCPYFMGVRSNIKRWEKNLYQILDYSFSLLYRFFSHPFWFEPQNMLCMFCAFEWKSICYLADFIKHAFRPVIFAPTAFKIPTKVGKCTGSEDSSFVFRLRVSKQTVKYTCWNKAFINSKSCGFIFG